MGVSGDRVRFSGGSVMTTTLLRATITLYNFYTAQTIIVSELVPFNVTCLTNYPLACAPTTTINIFFKCVFPVIKGNNFGCTTYLFTILTVGLLLDGCGGVIRDSNFVALVSKLSTLVASTTAFGKLNKGSLSVVVRTLLATTNTCFFGHNFGTCGGTGTKLYTRRLISILVILGVVVVKFSNVRFAKVSLNQVLDFLLVLVTSGCNKVVSNTVDKVSITFAFALSNVAKGVNIAITLTKLVSNIFTDHKGCTRVLVILNLSFVKTTSAKGATLVTVAMVRTLYNYLVCLFVPQGFKVTFNGIFSTCPGIAVPANIGGSVVLHLGLTSGTLGSISRAISGMSLRLSGVGSPGFDAMVSSVRRSTYTTYGLELRY